MRFYTPEDYCTLDTCEEAWKFPWPRNGAYVYCDVHRQWWQAQKTFVIPPVGGPYDAPPTFEWVRIKKNHAPQEIR